LLFFCCSVLQLGQSSTACAAEPTRLILIGLFLRALSSFQRTDSLPAGHHVGVPQGNLPILLTPATVVNIFFRLPRTLFKAAPSDVFLTSPIYIGVSGVLTGSSGTTWNRRPPFQAGDPLSTGLLTGRTSNTTVRPRPCQPPVDLRGSGAPQPPARRRGNRPHLPICRHQGAGAVAGGRGSAGSRF
jgi:hypothetical protein